MTDIDRAAFEKTIIDSLRANGGAVVSGPMAGAPLLVLTTTGARSGQPRRAILRYMRDGDDYVVAGSKGGAPVDPQWVSNLRANPVVTVEAGGTVMSATARITGEHDRAGLWTRLVAEAPQFGGYEQKAGRRIPMVRLTPSAG